MKYLLDTHILLWSLNEPSKLNRKTQKLISNTNNIVFVSTSTLWELQIKKSIGKISLPDNFSLLLEQGGYELLDIKVEHINKLNEIPLIHKDPFDRMLIAQSICENTTLITSDSEIIKYELKGFKNIVS
jgi:PIN domain nuclease of toxin-antitoxin system